jgi:hypothetical protein
MKYEKTSILKLTCWGLNSRYSMYKTLWLQASDQIEKWQKGVQRSLDKIPALNNLGIILKNRKQ